MTAGEDGTEGTCPPVVEWILETLKSPDVVQQPSLCIPRTRAQPAAAPPICPARLPPRKQPPPPAPLTARASARSIRLRGGMVRGGMVRSPPKGLARMRVVCACLRRYVESRAAAAEAKRLWKAWQDGEEALPRPSLDSAQTFTLSNPPWAHHHQHGMHARTRALAHRILHARASMGQHNTHSCADAAQTLEMKRKHGFRRSPLLNAQPTALTACGSASSPMGW